VGDPERRRPRLRGGHRGAAPLLTGESSPTAAGERAWWRDAVLYQLYPRSFQDSNGDGVGDLPGVLQRLDYLEWLGVDGIWLNPTMPSPNADWGYDVADYRGVHPELGTLDDLDRLVAAARERGIRILLDLVPNHSSDRHPWFLEARSSRDSPRRDWYVWADPGPNGSPPTDDGGSFGGPAWTWDDATGQYYLHTFLPQQPELNWRNDDVRDEFDRVMRFWLDRGVAGFRVDVVHRLVKSRRVREQGRRGEGGQPPVDLRETHAVLRRWRKLVDGYDRDRLLLGETHVLDVAKMIAFYGADADELHLAFNFPFLYAPLAAGRLRRVVERTEAAIPAASWPVWTASNHDAGRFPSRWCDGDERRIRCALVLLLTLRGTPVLYYGDEIGLTEPVLGEDDYLDCQRPTRDPCRTPMLWTAAEGGGFTERAERCWLPAGDPERANVAAQRDDPGSMLSLCRDLIRLRRELPALRTAPYATIPAPARTWAWRRGDGAAVALNLGERPASVDGIRGRIAVATARARDGERVTGRLRLGPWEGAVIVDGGAA
jgi:alpha-glucosidase